MPTFIRLTDYKNSDEKEQEFFNPENRYKAKQEDFEKIPGTPIAYWVSDKVISIIQDNDSVYNTARPRKGLVTLNDEQFLRRWYEVSLNDSIYNATTIDKSSIYKWFPITKGGETAKWYGNNNFLINWLNDGDDLKKYITFKSGDHHSRQIINEKYYLSPNVTWNGISSGMPSFRKSNKGFIISSSGPSSFPDLDYLDYFLAFLNSKSAFHILKIFSQTLSFLPSDIGKLPIIFTKSELKKSQIDSLAQQNIDISKEEWDSRETSWYFAQNELLRILNEKKPTLETVYNRYCKYWREKFFTLHSNEEELNRLFIEIYGLEDELTPEVDLKDITILKNEAKIVDSALVFDKKKL